MSTTPPNPKPAPAPGDWAVPSALPDAPPVPAFPMELFPDKLAEYWVTAAESLAVPPDYVAVPGLAMLGAAVGRSRAVEVKAGYHEQTALWVAVIAPPGSTKSAALKAAALPLSVVEKVWRGKHAAAAEAHQVAAERYAEQVRQWKKGGCEGDPPTKPVRPVMRQITLDGTTTEAAAKVLNDNARGVIVVKDELIGFVRAMDQYRGGGKGDDKQFWLSAWAGATCKVNRSGTHDQGPLFIPHPFVGVAGMMTPSSLPELRGEMRGGEAAADGFVDRFLFSFPDPMAAEGERWREVPDSLRRRYGDVFLDLMAFDLEREEVGDGVVEYRPRVVPFDDSARRVWETFTGAIATRKNTLDMYDPYRGVLSKLQGYGARLAGVVWAARRACGDLAPGDPIDGDTLLKATALVDYFDGHARRCLGVGWADRPSRVAKRLLGWLARHPDKGAFSRTEAFQQLKDRREVTSSQVLAPVFRILTDHGFVRPLAPTDTSRPGPVPEVYAVNPRWARQSSCR